MEQTFKITYKKKSHWSDFYAKRINSSYQEYFEERYKPFLSTITSNTYNNAFILEEGIGIGSVSKYLHKLGHRYLYGYDLSLEMIELCSENNHTVRVFKDDILNPINISYINAANFIITHGVLEHFTDNQIVSIFDRYENLCLKRKLFRTFHYVPLDKYEKPSFGDERLLPWEHWVDLINPTYYELFNNKHDLLLVK